MDVMTKRHRRPPKHIVSGIVEVRRVQVFNIEISEEHGCTTTEDLCDHAEKIVKARNHEGPPETEDIEVISFR